MQGSCPEGSGRSAIQAFEMFGFDVDDGDDPEVVREKCEELGVFVAIYPTFNDGKVWMAGASVSIAFSCSSTVHPA